MTRLFAGVSLIANIADRMLSLAAYSGVAFYRRFVSPRKGFRCAHAALTGGPSCSAVAAEMLLSQGFSVAYPAINRQRLRCREAYTSAMNSNSVAEQLLNSPIFAEGGNVIIKCC